MPRRILVVDDDPESQRVTCRFLEQGGHSWSTADTAIDALRYLKEGRVPELAILELRIADLPGPKLAQRIHAQQPAIPVLFVSGRPADPAETDRLGTLRWEFLKKPFTAETLLSSVERLLPDRRVPIEQP